jgi:succinoglycan biosynthesis protein ExoL
LEMLALATRARRRYAKNAVLVYECLDIHHMMLTSSVMRKVESHLLRSVNRVIVSAPGFVDSYLQPTHGAALPPVSLIENKMLRSEVQNLPGLGTRPPGPPWRIGWYGVLRCRRSLLLLLDLTRQLPGQIIVELRGRPSYTAIPDFDALLADAPYVAFLGAYDRSTDLARIYQDVHFTWAMDFYEAGQNSAWLLPNRLYEGGAQGAVPIADAVVATGQWLACRNAGILLQEPLASSLRQFFAVLDTTSYAIASAALADVASSYWIDDGQDAEEFITAIGRCRP